MKKILSSMSVMLRQVREDAMLFIALFAPLLITLAFFFLLPFVFKTFSFELTRYYLLFDFLSILMTPYMFSYISIMIVLTERDDKTLFQLIVSPLGRSGYLLSRLVVPVFIAFVYSLILQFFFPLSSTPYCLKALMAFMSSLYCLLIALLVINCSKNKVEGMAFVKLSSILLLFLFLPFFSKAKSLILLCFIPSFVMGKIGGGESLWYLLPFFFFSFLYGAFLYNWFKKRSI